MLHTLIQTCVCESDMGNTGGGGGKKGICALHTFTFWILAFFA